MFCDNALMLTSSRLCVERTPFDDPLDADGDCKLLLGAFAATAGLERVGLTLGLEEAPLIDNISIVSRNLGNARRMRRTAVANATQ